MKKLMTITMLLMMMAAAATSQADTYRPKGGPNAVTLWWVIFNNPEACLGNPGGGQARCSSVDVFGPAFLDSIANGTPDPALIAPNLDAELAVVYATGGKTNRRGKVELAASIYRTNGPLALPPGADPMGFGRGLENADAEVHLVVRNHGALNREDRIPQIANFLDPYCSDPNLLYFAGENLCFDEQFAIFAPGAFGEEAVFAFADPATPVHRAQAHLLRDGDVIRAIVRTRVTTE